MSSSSAESAGQFPPDVTKDGSGVYYVTPSYASDDVQTMLVSRVSDVLALQQLGGVSAESAEARVQSKRLSPQESKQLLAVLEDRFHTPNLCRPKGITFRQVKAILEADQALAYQVHKAEFSLGAEMDYIIAADGTNRFTDLRKETNVAQNVTFLDSIPREEKDAAIAILREKYPKIPADAFHRLPNDKSGPNKWEGLLIEELLQLESMPEADYRALQAKLPREQWLDINGISWLEASEEQLARGRAPDGFRRAGGVFVVGVVADNRFDIRGVRVRAKGSV